MNKIRQIQELNKRELEAGVSPSGSWHRDYDSAWIYIGGLPFSLSEGDIVTIFSQFGEPVYINLVRDKETGKSKGFAFLKYEDQRSTDLAVDNLSGAKILDRVISVDHSNYKKKDNEELSDNTNGFAFKVEERNPPRRQDVLNSVSAVSEEKQERPILKEEIELARLIQEHDPEDPMKEYLVQQKEAEIAKALKKSRQKSSRRNRSKSRDRSREKHKTSRKTGDVDTEVHHETQHHDSENGRIKHRHRSPRRSKEKTPRHADRTSNRSRERYQRRDHCHNEDSNLRSRSPQ